MTLHQVMTTFVTTFATPRVTHVLHVGDMWQARYCGKRDSANHSRTSSSSSLPDLVGFISLSSSSGESSDDDSELPQLECIEHTAVECRQCRPFPASHGCRPCRFSWPELDLRPELPEDNTTFAFKSYQTITVRSSRVAHATL